jgi:hypothetical protein
MTSSGSIKKKNLNEKEIFEFFYAIEDRFRQDESKIKKFMEIINQEGNVE